MTQISFDEMLAAESELEESWGRSKVDAKIESDFRVREYRNQAAFSLDSSKRRALSESELWARLQRDHKRPLVPRVAIPAKTRDAIFADDRHRCPRCHHHADDVPLHVGHILSLADAYDIRCFMLDTTAWSLANRDENLFTHCAKCNMGQGAVSFSKLDATKILTRPRVGIRDLDPQTVLDIQQWCDSADKWRPR